MVFTITKDSAMNNIFSNVIDLGAAYIMFPLWTILYYNWDKVYNMAVWLRILKDSMINRCVI